MDSKMVQQFAKSSMSIQDHLQQVIEEVMHVHEVANYHSNYFFTYLQ